MRFVHALLTLLAGCTVSIAFQPDARGAPADPLPEEPERSPEAAPAPATEAAGEAPRTWDFELGLKAGYTTAPISGGTTPFGAGVGGRAGIAFSGVYLGVSVVDYLGGKDVDVSDAALTYGVEAGYGLRLAESGRVALTLRPQVGLGGVTIFRTDPTTAAAASTTTGRGRGVDVVSSASGSSSSSNVTTVSAFYIEPGITMMLRTGTFFFAVNGNALVLPAITYSNASATWVAYGLQGQTGFVF
ncbi:hypothetical protein BH11MYX4_BH11MYX4_49570 [soil metagenome]